MYLSKEDGIPAYYFMSRSRRERFGARRRQRKGRTYSVKGTPMLCVHGMHGSRNILNALSYAPSDGWIACQVLLWGKIKEDTDKLVATNRTLLATRDAETTIRRVHNSHAHAYAYTDAYTYAHTDTDAHAHTHAYTDALKEALENLFN